MDNYNYRWWKEPKSEDADTAAHIFQITERIEKNQAYRTSDNLRHLRLYGNLDVLGLTSTAYVRPTSGLDSNRVTYNIVQSMIDTVAARIAKSKPKATFLTSGGDYSLKRKAKTLTKFGMGIFYKTDFYSIGQENFVNAAIFGTGPVKIFRDGKELKAEKVFPDELVVDDAEGRYGTPRSMYQTKVVDRDELCEMFPEFESWIRDAQEADKKTWNYGYDKVADQVKVVEAWHLKSGPDADDGRHIICINNKKLLDEKFTKDRFPFVFMRYTKRPLGFYGQGLAEQLIGVQIEINKLLQKIQASFEFLAVPRVWIEDTSKVNKAHMNNQIAGIGTYRGTPPIVVAPQTTNPEVFRHIETLFAKAYQLAGVSQLSSGSIKPAGLDSGVALREHQDIESERFSILAQNYERFYMEALEHFIELAQDVAEEYGDYEVVTSDSKMMEKIKWSEIGLDKDDYVMQIYPTSLLPTTPAGRLQTVQEMLQAGLIDAESALQLLDYPDLESASSLRNSALDDIDFVIDQIIEKGEYNTPEPFENLQAGIKRVQSAYLRAKINGVEQDKLEMLRQWIDEARLLLQPPPQLPAPGQAPPDQGQPPLNQGQLPQELLNGAEQLPQ